jgi:hypothetical protein
MKITGRRLLCFLFFILSLATGRAEKAADLKPVSVKAGKVMVEDNFDASALSKSWTVAKGDWQIKDGAVVGIIKKEEQHAAVLMLGVPNRNSIIRFSFKFDGNKGFGLSWNSAKGHLFRIIVDADGIIVSKDKDKKDEKSKSEAMAKAEGKFPAGQWHTMLVEVQGGKVSVQCDNGLKAAVSNSELDVDKTGYRFVTGASVQLDDLKVWQAE